MKWLHPLALTLIATAVLALAGAPAATADCNSYTSTGSCCGQYWYEYSPDIMTSACWSVDSGITTSTISCDGSSAWSYTGFSQHITRTLNVVDSGSTHWEAQANFDIIDPHASWWNQMNANVYVYHPGTGTTTYNLYNHNGTQGNVYCASPYVSFTAQQGDTITLDFEGSVGWTDSYVKVNNVHLFRITP